MKKLLFLFMTLGLFIACSDDDDKDNELPIKGLEIPKFENPVKPGESITIKGEGFTEASEIWFRSIVTRAENTGDVKATVTDVNSNGITFTAPEVYGNQSVLLKENGKEYELGKITFEEQSGESGDVEILPKKIKKVIITEEDEKSSDDYVFDYEYNADGKIKLVKETKYYGSVETSTYIYASNKITINIQETPDSYHADVSMDLKDDRLYAYSKTDEEKGDIVTNEYTYTYKGDYLYIVKGEETDSDNGDVETWTFEETFSYEQGRLMTYKYDTDGYYDLQEYTYGNQLNNLNIDLFAYIADDWDSYTGDGFLLNVLGKRSQYLPSSMKWTSPDDDDKPEIYMYTFTYKMDGDYIMEMTITNYKEGEKEDTSITRIQIFYED